MTVKNWTCSVMCGDGNTIVLFKLLQAKGLNRDLKRSLSELPKGAGCFDAIVTAWPGVAHLAEKDKQLIRRWSNPIARMGHSGTRQAGPAGGIGSRRSTT